MYVATFESTKTEANVFRLEGAAGVFFFFWKKSRKKKRGKEPKTSEAIPRHTYSSVLGVAPLRAWRVVFFFAKVRHINFFLG